jgi:NAD(P)-dependent dehydrogenase (short-subunit alcohol dehydrogenase family)
MAAYSASKAAVNQLTQSIALQYAAKGIRCNAVLPGLMATPMTRTLASAYGGADAERMEVFRAAQCPMGRTGDAWDVASAAVLLASGEARYITGHCLAVDGGLSCKAA